MTNNRQTSVIGQIILTMFGLAILGGAGFGFWYLITHKPKAKRRKKPPTLKPMVEVAPLKKTSVTIKIQAMGTVIPTKESMLKAQVSGRITTQHRNFVEGGIVSEGMEIMTIDPRDYALAVKQAETAVVTASANLALERGNQDIAQREWDLLGKDVAATANDRELVLRKPQLQAKEAELTMAKLKLEQARLNESRSSVKAPFNAVVKSVDAQRGDLASTQTVLGRLICTDSYWVRVSVPMSQLQWVTFPKAGQPGASVLVHQSDTVTREGRVVKLLSGVETAGRMAQVLVEVTDPLDLKRKPNERRRPLLLNEFVRATIVGDELKDLTAIDRSAFRDGAKLWLISPESTLRVRATTPIWTDSDQVYLREVFDPGYRLITSNLGYPLDGMALRVKGEPEASKKKTPETKPEERP